MKQTLQTKPLAARPHVVIVGGGFGGIEAAHALAKAPVRITLVDRSNHHLFQPLLYQVAMAGLSPADIATPIRSILSKQRNAQVLLGEVSSVDLEQRRLTLEGDSPLAYDYIVLAYGAKTNYFGHDDWARYALGMKTIEDAVEMRRRVLLAFEAAEREADPDVRRRLLTFVVIGGGPTGVEVAGALIELGRFVLAADFRVIRREDIRVVLVEAQDRLLPAGFDPKSSTAALRQLETLGVEVRLGTPVESIDAHGVELAGEAIASTTIVWTAGVRGKRLGESLGRDLDRSHRIPVTADCSIPGHPEAFAIGDCAAFVPEGEKAPLPGVSPVAMQQGRFVAQVIEARASGETPPQRFEYVDKGIMATVGRSRAVAEVGKIRLSGLVAWLAWLVVHIWYLVGFRNQLAVFLTWVWSYMTYKRGARLITGGRPWEDLHRLSARARPGDEGAPSGPPADSAAHPVDPVPSSHE
jgi:NADH:ubiquinone reductase (H+-translocating)